MPLAEEFTGITFIISSVDTLFGQQQTTGRDTPGGSPHSAIPLDSYVAYLKSGSAFSDSFVAPGRTIWRSRTCSAL